MTAQNPERFLTHQQVAALIGIRPRTLADWLQDGHFPAPMYMWPEQEVYAWLADSSESAMATDNGPGDSATRKVGL